MKLRIYSIGALLVLASAAYGQKEPSNKLVVHEWGTFLSMNGSDGVTLDGMYHEEHALPGFVHSLSKELTLGVNIKGETPVIYFYTKKPQSVKVAVDFKQGEWTQWYPAANAIFVNKSGPNKRPNNGRIVWNADLTPASSKGKNPEIPETVTGALWNYARDVDAAFVHTRTAFKSSSRDETERYIFYRGLGRAQLPLEANTGGGGTLSVSAGSGVALKHLFVIRVENGKGAYRYIPSLSPGSSLNGVIPSMQDAKPAKEFTKNVADELASRLTECGLYAKEARAMVNTWRSSYFQADGIRVLYVLPQTWTDGFIPMTITPKPEELVRVMVGRTELLTAERERRTEQAVRNLISSNAANREAGFRYLWTQGRYVEPIIRRTRQTAKDPAVRDLCSRLLKTNFVTALRSTAYQADTGAPVEANDTHLKTQLAGLLTEIGIRPGENRTISSIEKKRSAAAPASVMH
jgi:hypothetical protein